MYNDFIKQKQVNVMSVSTLKQLKMEVEELKLDAEIAQSRYRAAMHRLSMYTHELRMAKQSKCKHEKTDVREERVFDGDGFADYEYDYCLKCGAVLNNRVVNTVLTSEK